MTDNQARLLEVVKYELRSPVLNDEGLEITDDTTLGDVLSDSDGAGSSNSKTIFESAIRWVIDRNKLAWKPWPTNWLTMSARAFAEAAVFILLLALPFAANSQLKVNLSGSRTDLQQAALTIAMSYSQSVADLVDKKTFFHAGSHSSLIIYPEMAIQTGTADAFGAITARVTALAMTFRTTTIAGLQAPDLHRTFHTFPVAIGIETNKNFSFINTVLQAGWAPYFPDIRGLAAGAGIQAGYKAQAFSDSAIGGAKDESAEPVNEAILRGQAYGRYTSPALAQLDFFKVGLVASADGWYDAAHGATYYRLEGTLRVYLREGQYIDFFYQKGSGAPLFNDGDQLGVGLSLIF